MNIFRLTGDLSHLAAIVILLLKIWKTRSCAGKRRARPRRDSGVGPGLWEDQATSAAPRPAGLRRPDTPPRPAWRAAGPGGSLRPLGVEAQAGVRCRGAGPSSALGRLANLSRRSGGGANWTARGLVLSEKFGWGGGGPAGTASARGFSGRFSERLFWGSRGAESPRINGTRGRRMGRTAAARPDVADYPAR